MSKQVFSCPACKLPVAAQSGFERDGLKCPQCGTGWMPEGCGVAARSVPEEKPDVPYLAWGIMAGLVALGLVLSLLGPVLGTAMIWVGVVLAALGLLVGIFVKVSQLAARK